MEIIVKETDSPEAKREAWGQIQKLSPDMAEFIKSVTAVFGKPESVKVEAI